MSYFRYEQNTGDIYDYSGPKPVKLGTGYSGKAAARNDGHWQDVPRVGPIPKGAYIAIPARAHPRLGPVAIDLVPFPTNEMHGRSAFLIHGDNAANDASEGCIILNRSIREYIDKSYKHGREKCYIVVV